MNTLIHADVFFFVTTIVVIIVGALLATILIYLVKIMNDVKHITRSAKEEAGLVREDIKELRAALRKEGFKIERTWALAKHFIKRRKTK